DLRAAVRAGHAQMLEALQRSALALPVPDGELDEVERAGLPEVREREDAGEDRLQARVFTLLGEEVHLQEAVVRLALDVDQIRHRSVHADGSFGAKTRPPPGVKSAGAASSKSVCPALNEV